MNNYNRRAVRHALDCQLHLMAQGFEATERVIVSWVTDCLTFEAVEDEGFLSEETYRECVELAHEAAREVSR